MKTDDARYADYLKEHLDKIDSEEVKAPAFLYLEGYDIRTIAYILQRNENTIKSNLRKARFELEDIINQS